MKDIVEILLASQELFQGDEYDPPDDPNDNKVILAKKLESEGKRVICVGAGLITIERTENHDNIEQVTDGWGILKITVYSDPDISCIETPDSIIYIKVGKYGLRQVQLDSNGSIKSLF
jgi:hypothetical protein